VAADNRAVDFTSMGLVLNRVKDLSEVDDIRKGQAAHLRMDRRRRPHKGIRLQGRSLTELPETSFALGVVADILGGMGLLGKAGE
jgi:hypothetical protein